MQGVGPRNKCSSQRGASLHSPHTHPFAAKRGPPVFSRHRLYLNPVFLRRPFLGTNVLRDIFRGSHPPRGGARRRQARLPPRPAQRARGSRWSTEPGFPDEGREETPKKQRGDPQEDPQPHGASAPEERDPHPLRRAWPRRLPSEPPLRGAHLWGPRRHCSVRHHQQRALFFLFFFFFKLQPSREAAPPAPSRGVRASPGEFPAGGPQGTGRGEPGASRPHTPPAVVPGRSRLPALSGTRPGRLRSP